MERHDILKSWEGSVARIDDRVLPRETRVGDIVLICGIPARVIDFDVGWLSFLVVRATWRAWLWRGLVEAAKVEYRLLYMSARPFWRYGHPGVEASWTELWRAIRACTASKWRLFRFYLGWRPWV